MKLKLFVLTVITSFILHGCSSCVEAGQTSYGNINKVEYVRNYDGDTITVNIPGLHPLIGKEISVRVFGIDTPEIRGGCIDSKKKGFEAKYFVAEACKNSKRIKLVNLKRDKYFRILATVYIDGENLAATLITKELAKPYYGGTKEGWCK